MYMYNYNSNFICTYGFYDPKLRQYCSEKYDLNDVNDFEDMSELIYQSELLQIFKISSINNDFNTEKIIDLYNIIKLNLEFNECIEKIKKNHVCENFEIGFMILFSYDYFFLTHKCICDFLNTGKICDEYIDDLNKLIHNK